VGAKLLVAALALIAGAGLAVAAVLAGRDSAPKTPAEVVELSYGHGADRVWIFRPAHGKPKHVVLFVHGLGDQLETTPVHHKAWLEHLAAEGNAVLYPRFELHPAASNPLRHLLSGARLGWKQLGVDAPVLAIGYSRGGRLVMDYAALAHGVPPVPRTILSVFPAGSMDPLQDLGTIRKGTKVVLLAGDHDEVVGTHGVNQLVTQLAASGFPYGNLTYQVVRSQNGFFATHLSVMDDTEGAHAAYWDRADRLLDEL
jgi:acetyl esterase/lipase